MMLEIVIKNVTMYDIEMSKGARKDKYDLRRLSTYCGQWNCDILNFSFKLIILKKHHKEKKNPIHLKFTSNGFSSVLEMKLIRLRSIANLIELKNSYTTP